MHASALTKPRYYALGVQIVYFPEGCRGTCFCHAHVFSCGKTTFKTVDSSGYHFLYHFALTFIYRNIFYAVPESCFEKRGRDQVL